MMMADEYNFYHSLVLLQGENIADDQLALNQVQANQKTLKMKALHAPMNFQHKYDLVEAEIARVTGNILAAMEFYDKSAKLATTHGYIQVAALANELAAEFYLAIGRERTSIAYMTDAYRGYLSWSAFSKAKDLAIRYPDLIETMILGRQAPLISTSGTPAALFDLATVVKASQAIAREIVPENLLNNLIKIVIENAGAQAGFLIAVNQSDFFIQVAGTADQNQVFLLPLTESNIAAQLPLSVLNYVLRTQETLVLNNAAEEGFFTTDPYIIHNQPKSILCTPIIYQGQLKNILYLQNNLTTAFTVERLEVLRLLSAQIAVSLENAELYSNLSAANTQLEAYSQSLEATVVERTQELQQKNTSLEKITQQLKITNQELETFSYSVSHDLRAPLRRIDTFSKMILQVAGDNLNPEIVDYLQRIQNANLQMGQLIEDLLTLSQINRYEIRTRPVDLTAMVSAIAQTLQQAEPDRQVEWQIQPGVTAIADPRLLHVGLENLVSNAWKYTRKQLHPKIEFGMARSGVYFIRDNGAGFNMKYIHQLFKAFQRLHSASEFEGNGIGLATVLRVIQRHGGEIFAEGAIEQGATFYFTLLSVG
jgi:signal transduction histidine kinase